MAVESTLPGPSKLHSGDHIGTRRRQREATLNGQWLSSRASMVVKGRFGRLAVGLSPAGQIAGPKLQAMTPETRAPPNYS